jgi:peptidyl-prolyl cis-trans isomerase D
MLEQMRKSSQSLLIYVLFGIVIAVFIINFGPQSRNGGHGCEGAMGGDESAARVDGETISTQAYHYGFMLLGGANQPPQILKLRRFRETVMDRLIERELLAQEAERLGFAVSEDDVNKMLLDGKIVGLGIPHVIPRIQKDGVFNYDQFKNFTMFELGLTPERFVEQQQRELLAAEVRDLMRASVKVSPEEIKTAFEAKNRQVNLEYVRFPSRKYEGEVEPTADQIAAYAKANEAKLKEAFTQRKSMYTDMPPEIRVREILVKSAPAKGSGAGADVVDTKGAASADAADAKADKAAKDSLAKSDAAARKRADALAARLTKGEPFGKVAREASEDEDGRGRGGDLGWRRKGTLGLEPADEGKLFAAKAGTVVGPFKTAQGFVLLTAAGTRQGTLTYDAAKAELAEERVRQDQAGGLAKQHAEAALAAAKAAPDQTLKQLFPGPPEAASADATDKPAALKLAKPAAKTAPASDARAEETGFFSRRGTVVEQIGDSPALAKAAFELKPGAALAGPFEIAGSFVVVRLKERKDPDPKELEAKQAELQRDAELVKWNEVLTGWVKSRCLEEKAAGRITVNPIQLHYDDNQAPLPYEPCVGDTDGSRRPPS